MKSLTSIILATFGFSFLSISPNAFGDSNLRVSNLRCEHLVNPLGVDAAKPRLSWNLVSQIKSARGEKQSHYHILVASSPEKLATNTGDLWDTGKVKSDKTGQIDYEGKPLQSDTRYFWKVKVWDQNKDPSPFSSPATWQTGLYEPSDWEGKWIGDLTQKKIPQDSNTTQAQPSPRFRKSFDLGKGLKRATLFISGIGYHESWINGQRVGDHVLDPAFTRYDKGVLYVSHDVTEQLKRGSNTIGIQLGNGWYNMHARAVWNFDQAPWRDSPRVIAQLNITYADGSTDSIVTDKTWSMGTGPIVFDSIRNGEIYDARLETPGWNKNNFTGSGWEQADEVPAPAGKLRSQMMPPIRVTQTIKPIKLTEPKPGVYVFDLGQNISGWVKFKLSGPGGTQVSLRYSERIDDRGMIDQENIGAHLRDGGYIQKDIYILKGEGIEEQQARFTYHGFQYVEVTGLPDKPSLEDMTGVVVHTDFETIGNFECSNELINDIHRIAQWAFRGNYHGYPTDCPHREKNGWTGDAHLAAEMGLFNYKLANAYDKWINDFEDEQQADGSLPGIIPTAGWGYSWGNGPAWDSAGILIPWYVYLYTGDSHILDEYYDMMKRYVDHMEAWAKNDRHILEYGLGDWCRLNQKTSPALTSTGYYYADARILSKAAAILGKAEDHKKYADLARSIKNAFNKKFYKGEGIYGSGSQTANSCALYQGLAEESEIPLIIDKLVANIESNDGHLNVGILGAKYLFNALTENGQHDLAYKIATKTTFPGYGYWLAQGATTMWEDWRGKNSRNHIFFGDIDAWFYKHLAGINYDPEAPGFKHIIVHPRPTGDLTWAKADHQSPHGLIQTSWSIKNNEFTLRLTVPVNTTATVHVPGQDVREGELPARDVEGVTFLHATDHTSVFKVGSGTYQFSSSYRDF